MNSLFTAGLTIACLLTAIGAGVWLRRLLPGHHLSSESRDTVKLAMGLVATMAALLLGLLVSSAKGNYDTTRTQMIQMAAKVAFIDRLLELYGPEAQPIRAQFRIVVEEAVSRIWGTGGNLADRLGPKLSSGDAVYLAIQQLAPADDAHRALKTQAASLATELGQLRALLLAESVTSIAQPLLIAVGCWLVAIFFSFSLLAPTNATANLALIVSALSVSAAIYLILELDQPFGGLIRISSAPITHALQQLPQ